MEYAQSLGLINGKSWYEIFNEKLEDLYRSCNPFPDNDEEPKHTAAKILQTIHQISNGGDDLPLLSLISKTLSKGYDSFNDVLNAQVIYKLPDTEPQFTSVLEYTKLKDPERYELLTRLNAELKTPKAPPSNPQLKNNAEQSLGPKRSKELC